MTLEQEIIQRAQSQSIEDFAPDARFWIYGSPLRPMSQSWARIPGAIFVNADKQYDGVYTWVVVPRELDIQTAASYELVLKYEQIQQK